MTSHDQTIAQTIAAALDLWVELTGVDLNATRLTLRDWDIHTMNEELKETLRLDESGVSTYLLLECFLRDYLEQKAFTAATIMKNYAALTAFLAKAQNLFSIVQNDDACEMAATFRTRVIESLRGYEADDEKTVALVNNADILPFLRRDALRSLDSLRPYQFLSGPHDNQPPRLINRVYTAWDINKLLPAIRDMALSGVALILIRDPAHRDRSYFCFAIRNGENVIILTDKTKWAHPGQADMTRRPDRTFATRAWQNHFPYQLLKFGIEENRIKFDPEQDIVVAGPDLVPLMPISQLEPHQVVWVTMMLSLIADKFWKKQWVAPELAYTGAMIETKAQLITDPTGRLLPVAQAYRPISLERLAVSEVTAEALSVKAYKKPQGVNAWMEQRYQSHITEEAINQWLLEPGAQYELPPAGHGTGIALAVRRSPSLMSENHPYALQSLSPAEFGTEAELKADRLWIARFNAAKQVQKAADEEFLARKDEVFQWYSAAVLKNLSALLEAIRLEKMPGMILDHGFSGSGNKMGNILRFGALKDETVWGTFDYHNGVRLGAWRKDTSGNPRRCVITDAAASYRARFSPQTADSLAQLAGCAVSDLPDVLQHWMLESPYTGNSILDRLDPMDTVVKDPWQELALNVNVYLSKRIYDKVKCGKTL